MLRHLVTPKKDTTARSMEATHWTWLEAQYQLRRRLLGTGPPLFTGRQLAPGSWQLGPGRWQLGPGSWQLGPGSRQLGLGSWQLSPSSWQLEVMSN